MAPSAGMPRVSRASFTCQVTFLFAIQITASAPEALRFRGPGAQRDGCTTRTVRGSRHKLPAGEMCVIPFPWQTVDIPANVTTLEPSPCRWQRHDSSAIICTRRRLFNRRADDLESEANIHFR